MWRAEEEWEDNEEKRSREVLLGEGMRNKN